MGNGRDESDDKKRKRLHSSGQHSSGRNKKKELGRGEYNLQRVDKRAQNEQQIAKRQKLEAEGADGWKQSVLPKPFSQEEIAAEQRKPKHKVAVLIGYSGTGYRGMQINTTERTIEGDLFTAFVSAGAISKANANDPKKSGLVRCARTDKGVHAAGNVVSLKLIVEEPKIVEKINSHLSEQIRVWGIQRTVGSFSCYQACDSRWYEYLIPSHAFLPPHPRSFLGRKIFEIAEEKGESDALKHRQEEVHKFWNEAEAKHISPIIEELGDPLKGLIVKAIFESNIDPAIPAANESVILDPDEGQSRTDSKAGRPALTETVEAQLKDDRLWKDKPTQEQIPKDIEEDALGTYGRTEPASNADENHANRLTESSSHGGSSKFVIKNPVSEGSTLAPEALDFALRKEMESTTKRIRAAYLISKRNYRIPSARLKRIEAALAAFVGTNNFHNYTVNKTPRDPSAMRLIKSFTLDTSPKIINGTEWLSLKIHGQSFMMHQIRKMVSAVAMVVRCGCPISRITDTLTAEACVSIPKVPGLGLLLERPVFQSYNENVAAKYGREKIDFGKYEVEMENFKQKEIYERIFREEEDGQQFHTFFGHVDSFKENTFLWVTSMGTATTTTTGLSTQPNSQIGAKSQENEPTTMASVDSGDEESANECGRVDMDG